ncbi:MAG: hypothetical protein AB1814_18910 [Thermodesulfobacteriota bacterium]
MSQGNQPPADRFSAGLAALLGLLLLALAVVYTWPLAANFGRGLPYVYWPVPGYEQVPLIPGDHLQFYYWCWLFIDNLLGPSPLFTNPYEFSTFLHPQGIALYANFPLSLLYLALRPLGALPAYNALVLLSYLLAGLMAFALARQALHDDLAAWPAALIFALLPFRASQVLSGHLFGFVAFLLPLCLWCLERGWQRRPWLWGAGAGLALLSLGLMEGHLFYYSTLLLGLYVPLRLIMRGREDAPQEEAAPDWTSLAKVLAAGLALGAALHLAALRAGAAAAGGLAGSLGLGLVVTLVLWLLLSWLAVALTSLGPAACRRVLAQGLLPLLLGPLYGVQFWLPIPHLGKLLALAVLVLGAAFSLPKLWRARQMPAWPAGTWAPLIPLGLGWGLGVVAMLINKHRVMDASIAGAGRALAEVRLFSPRLGDLFSPQAAHSEQIVYLGLVLLALALAGLVLLALGRPAKAKGGMLAALWTALGLLAGLLCLGPNLPQLPLYGFLYRHLPFFNFPRVPGRLVILAVLLLALAGGWALRGLARPLRNRRGALIALGLALSALIVWDLWPPARTGICLVPPPGPLEAAVRGALPAGPKDPQRLLGLPIWPGDSHQSSVYEFLVTRTRARLVNGYAPLVPRAYVQQVFWPLYPLDLGEVNQTALQTMQRLKVGLVAFYSDAEVYPSKVSPFPPDLARQRLQASGAFRLLRQEGNVFLLRPDYQARPDGRESSLSSPATILWPAAWLGRDTGRLVEDKRASGWGLLFGEPMRPGAPLGPRLSRFAGNVAQMRAGRDQAGWLSRGPERPLPPGDYLVRFRLRRGPGPAPGRVEVSDQQGRVLASAALTPERLPADGAWHDVGLRLKLEAVTRLELRTYASGLSDLELNLVLVGFADQAQPQAFYAASQLWRQAGDLLADPTVPGGLAVAARRGYTPPLYLVHGPQQTYPAGRYQARFRLALLEPSPAQAPAAELVVATDLGRLVLGHRQVKASQLAMDYRDIAVDFTLPRQAELDLRVLYGQGASLKLAGVSVQPAP